MKYEEMSDFEISRAVAKALGGKDFGDGMFVSESRRYDVGPDKKGKFFFDPCNSWADVGPIMEEYKIGIDPECVRKNDNGGYDEVWSGVVYDEFCRVRFALCGKDKNPMRAAMITFLMLKDSK